MKKLDLQAPVSILFTSQTGPSTTVKASLGGAGGMQSTNTLSSLSGNMSNTQLSGSLNVGGYYAEPAVYRGYYWNWFEPYRTYHYTTPDKFEVGFKLARKLMDKKLVKPQKTVEDFFKLMDAIVDVL